MAGSPRRLLVVATGNITNAALLSLFERHLDTIVGVLDGVGKAGAVTVPPARARPREGTPGPSAPVFDACVRCDGGDDVAGAAGGKPAATGVELSS